VLYQGKKTWQKARAFCTLGVSNLLDTPPTIQPPPLTSPAGPDSLESVPSNRAAGETKVRRSGGPLRKRLEATGSEFIEGSHL
jgi:hypothetical protein